MLRWTSVLGRRLAPLHAWNRSYGTMSASDLLKVAVNSRNQATSIITKNATLLTAVEKMAAYANSSTLIVVDEEKKVVGLLTQNNIISSIAKQGPSWKDLPVKDAAMPTKDIIHVTPDDPLPVCRAVMTLSGRSELPVISGDSLLGIISLTDIAALISKTDSQSDGETHSAKSDYIHLILPRKGLPKNTSVASSAMYASARAHIANLPRSGKPTPCTQFYLHAFALSIPHPQKVATGGEDAYFLGTSASPAPTKPSDVLCFGVADGVGSWFEQGISAGKYSRELMKAAQAAARVSETKDPLINPSEVLNAAWHSVNQHSIVGSATACVVSLDPNQCELYAVNLGDSGFLIIRDKKSDLKSAEMRGTLDGSLMRKLENRDTDLTPAGRRKGAHVSYRSPQQLHYFNCPFQVRRLPNTASDRSQLGYFEPGPDMPAGSGPLFETPAEAVNLRVPVMEGDLIVLATDGLFDNVNEEQLLEIVASEPEVEAMTKKLVKRAYDLSLDRTIDSPFARLAKENDKMWGGGMPDDITIIVARVLKCEMLLGRLGGIGYGVGLGAILGTCAFDMSIRVYNKEAFEDLQQQALSNSRSPTTRSVTKSPHQHSGLGSANTSDLSTATRQKRLQMKHEIYQKEQEELQKKLAHSISENLAKERNRRDAKYLRLQNEIDEGKALAAELEERLVLKEESEKRQKQRLYDEWTEKVYNRLNHPINDKVRAMDAKQLNQHKQEAYQRFLDAANKKGCLFRDIIIESDYDPLHDHTYIKQVARVDDPSLRVLKNRESEEAIANEGRHITTDSMDAARVPGTVLGRADNLDTKLWAAGTFESTPYGYFNKMMSSTMSEEGSKTYESRVKFDHYDVDKTSATLNGEFPRGKRTIFEGVDRKDKVQLG
ncbi:phosphatase PTC7 family protein [Achlya hypogyna]|uniref:Phosphatase PTC7 family protein n=1 Tax=Achlya hypogyna TaxID=1202772 RepID=A0A1V9Z9D8_ACHHY|nr:phosphatase PTC7 family protein [Achlya hypogyna]